MARVQKFPYFLALIALLISFQNCGAFRSISAPTANSEASTSQTIPSPSPSATPVDLFSSYHFNGETMSQYYTLRLKKLGLITTQSGTAESEFSTNPVSSTKTDINWGDPAFWPGTAGNPQIKQIEEWEVKPNCVSSRDFVWLNAYRNDNVISGTSARFRITASRAEIRIDGGAWTNIMNGSSCYTEGQPYMLHDVATDGYTIRTWGKVWAWDNSASYDYFWQAHYTYTDSSANTCWQTDSLKTRSAIKQEEAWWSNNTTAPGWRAPSTGSIDVSGEPDGTSVTYGAYQYIGKNAGAGWVSASGKDCLQTLSDW